MRRIAKSRVLVLMDFLAMKILWRLHFVIIIVVCRVIAIGGLTGK